MKVGRSAIALVLIAGSAAMLVPFYMMLTMALKTPHEIDVTSPWSWPAHPTLENFRSVLTNPNVSFPLFFKNTCGSSSWMISRIARALSGAWA